MAPTGAVGSTTGSVDSLLNGGSLLDANINLHADANLAAPVDGAVAANGNVAAPVDAAVGANIGSAGCGLRGASRRSSSTSSRTSTT